MNFEAAQITTIVVTISGIISFYLKIRSENKANKKELVKFLLERFAGMEDKLNHHMIDWTSFKNDALFRMKFRNAIAERASTILISSRALKTLYEFNSVLLNWVNYTQDFGLKFWYSSYRMCNNPNDYNEQDLRDYIELDLTSFLNAFESELKSKITVEKAYMINNKRVSICFADFLKTKKCYILSELLLIDLIKNGFDKDGHGYRTRFERYTMDFINQFVDAVLEWRELENYDDVLAREIDKL